MLYGDSWRTLRSPPLGERSEGALPSRVALAIHAIRASFPYRINRTLRERVRLIHLTYIKGLQSAALEYAALPRFILLLPTVELD
jgi:hypothetical protein